MKFKYLVIGFFLCSAAWSSADTSTPTCVTAVAAIDYIQGKVVIQTGAKPGRWEDHWIENEHFWIAEFDEPGRKAGKFFFDGQLSSKGTIELDLNMTDAGYTQLKPIILADQAKLFRLMLDYFAEYVQTSDAISGIVSAIEIDMHKTTNDNFKLAVKLAKAEGFTVEDSSTDPHVLRLIRP